MTTPKSARGKSSGELSGSIPGQMTLPMPGVGAFAPAILGIPRSERVFVNRSLRLARIEWVGFDMDYTLAVYKQERFDALSIELTIEKMIERGYPEYLRKVHYDPRFPIRGLLIDKRLGNVLKMNRFKVVQKGYHGYDPLPRDTVKQLYHEKRIRPNTSRYRWIDTLFEMSEVAAFAGIVEAFEKRKERVNPAQLFDDIRSSIDGAHRDGSIYRAVTADFPRFVERDVGLARTLHRLRSAGKKLFLLTNSPAHYTESMMAYLVDGAMPEYPTWRNYFDVVITAAMKPGWFLEGREFMECDGDVFRAVHGKFERGKVYAGGNLKEFETLAGIRGNEVLYVGDHIYGDMLRSKKESSWRTALIIPELGQELAAHDASELQMARLHELEGVRNRLDDELRYYNVRWKESRRPESNDEETTLLRRRMERVRGELRAINAEQRDLSREVDRIFHPYWGSLLKDRHEMSMFGVQVDHYADIYMRRVRCLEPYSPHQHFRSPHEFMPHEL
jgi:5'-nucleotidase